MSVGAVEFPSLPVVGRAEGRFMAGCCRTEAQPITVGTFRCPECGCSLLFRGRRNRRIEVFLIWPGVTDAEVRESWDDMPTFDQDYPCG